MRAFASPSSRYGETTLFFSVKTKTEETLVIAAIILTFPRQSKIRYSKEAQVALESGRGYASGLRRAAKRRLAFSSVQPFTVATVGFGDAYLYCKGVLCYTLDDKIRVLDLHRSGAYETVIHIPKLLSEALLYIDDHSRGLFQVLYYSDDIISCLYTSHGPDSAAWLIAFSLQGEILLQHNLDTAEKIFVRHNSEYLYFGTHSEIGPDGYRRWLIQGCQFGKKQLFKESIYLEELVGSEIGSTVAFEIHNGYFYALSNQTSFEVEEIDWTSFYHCLRFPLASPSMKLCEKTVDERIWRRQHREGPIDDRWTNLRLDVDEATGKLRIMESRKEWYQGSSKSQRTYYITNIKFKPSSLEELADDPGMDFSMATNSFESCAVLAASSTGTTSELMKSRISTLPDERIVQLIGHDDHPNYFPALRRLPQHTHPGDDGSSRPTFTLAKSRLRCYDTSSSTFLDLVDDPLPSDWHQTQRLRLRGRSRRLRPPLRHPAGHQHAGLIRPPSEELEIALKEMYEESPITFWPEAQDPMCPNPELDAIYRLLNPPTHLGNVEGTADERSLVYLTGGTGSPQAIIFISFDPAIKLEGLKKFGDQLHPGQDEGILDSRKVAKNQYIDVEEDHRTVVIEQAKKGKGRAPCSGMAASYSPQVTQMSCDLDIVSSPAHGPTPHSPEWIWQDKMPMHKTIGLGYYFGL